MNGVFDPLNIGSIRLRNRIVRSATHEGMTENGDPDERLVDLYEEMCDGGVGCIITGYAAISKEGKAPTENMLMFDDDSHIEGFRKLAQSVKNKGVPIVLQLAHCGRQTRRAVTGEQTVAPSAIKDWLYNEEVPREMDEKDIKKVIDDFIDSAVRAETAGFDAVEIHAAHGYLLSSFLSPHMNRRKDSWGGSTENRFKIIDEIIKGIRKISNIPVLIKINCFERSRDGIKTEESVKIAKLAETSGFDAIEVSCGIMEEGLVMCRGTLPYETMLKTNFRMRKFPKMVQRIAKPYIERKMGSPQPIELYNLDAARDIRNNVNIPVIVVGGIRKYSDIEKIIENGECDAVSMSRPFVIEPDIVERFKNGQERSSCIECNKCLLRAEGHVLRCVSSPCSNRSGP